MDVILVRHGESEGNLAGQLQGHLDSPLTPLGRAQATRVGNFLRAQSMRWSAAYVSPLARTRETAALIVERTGFPDASVDDDLREIGAGGLEGLTRTEMGDRFPTFLTRAVTDLGDFSEYGGESYDAVQIRVTRVLNRLKARHRAASDVVLVVAHGGINFQLAKAAICVPSPRVCILHWGNCTTSLLRFRDRRGTYMAEVAWHMPVDLITGDDPGADSSGVFR